MNAAACYFVNLMESETSAIARGLRRRDPDLLDRLIEQYQHQLLRYLVYLAGNRELAQRYELVRQELAGAVLLNETLGAPSARAMEKLFAAISAKEAHGSRCRDSARERLH